MKQLVLRFDVDTHKCVKEGIPNLIALGKRQNVQFTFFVHFGRAVSQKDFLVALIKKSKPVKKHAHLSALTKLGFKNYLIAAFLNPQIGIVGQKDIRDAIHDGHEIGLHGGRNHETWNREAPHWSKGRVYEEISWGVNEMKKISPSYKMRGFASPHWKGNNRIYTALAEKGFTYVSDIHSNKPLQKVDTKKSLPNIPNNISGEPMGVGYIEWCRAKNMSDDQILGHFSEQLSKRRRFATMYDHPYYAGVSEIDILEKMIVLAKQKNFKIVTLGKLFKSL